MRVIVTGNLGTYQAGQVLETESDIVAYYRVVLNEGGSDDGISDEQILEAIKLYPGDGEDVEVQRIEALEKAAA